MATSAAVSSSRARYQRYQGVVSRPRFEPGLGRGLIAERQEEPGLGPGGQGHVAVVAGDVGHHPGAVDQGRGVLQPAGGEVRLAADPGDKRFERRPVLGRDQFLRPVQGVGRQLQIPAEQMHPASRASLNASCRRPPDRGGEPARIRPGPPPPRRNARCPRPAMPWMARILACSSANPSAAWTAWSSQPAARSGMPRWTDR